MKAFQPIIGILALQGAFFKHAEAIKALNAIPQYIRYPHELDSCHALIIPGGESTTISKQIDFVGLREAILNFAQQKPLFGTCAGLIMMAKSSQGSESLVQPNTFGLMDVEVSRNGYGSQYESFSTEITTIFDKHPFHAVFIRGPRISSLGANVEVLAYFQNEPVLIRQGSYLAATFHPELTNDLRIHRYFLDMIA